MTVDASLAVCNLGVLDTLTEESFDEIGAAWDGFCSATESLFNGGDLSLSSEFVSNARSLCNHDLESLVLQHFFTSIQETFEKKGSSRFWNHFEPYNNFTALGINKNPIQEDEIQQVLCKALEEITSEKQYEEKCLMMLVHALQQPNSDALQTCLFSKYQLLVASILLTTLPRHFPDVLHWYFQGQLVKLSTIMEGDSDNDDMDLDEKINISCKNDRKRISGNSKLVRNIGMVVRDLRNVGFTSIAEDAYASAIFSLLKAKVHDLAGDDYRNSVLQSIKTWIKDVPLQFLHALLTYLGDSDSLSNEKDPSSGLKSPLASRPSSCCFGSGAPSEGLVRWQLRLEYFAYETLQDLRVSKLFDIIVDYPDSAPSIEDLKECLDYTGQHAKLVESFISSLKYRLLTAGASTNDILHQYVSTIKALKTIDPAGIFLEAVGEPIREYLRGRKDTIKCIVTMLTDGSGGSQNGPGSVGDSLLEELNRDEENQESLSFDDDINNNNIDDKQAWINSLNWEPDPVEADPLKGNMYRRKVDILGMIVGLIGSKDQLVNEYRVMLAEKLLNKSDYDIDSEIRTLELLKIHFGEGSLQKCEIMINDLIDSKRTNTNIKATIKKQLQPVSGVKEDEVSLDNVNATILSSNFWPPIQDEAVNLPESVEKLLSDYAKRFHEVKTPRKLLWKKNLGTVKLELQFEGRSQQFTVTPLHASIIMQFQDIKSWSSKNLASSVGVPVDVLNRRINFWISKGILAESASGSERVINLVESIGESGKSGSSEEVLLGDEEGERSVASVEDQLRIEMTIYEKFITGMLTNFGSMALDRIHNTLKMFCIADPPYDKSIQQLQSFLSGLVAEEKLEFRDGKYFLKK